MLACEAHARQVAINRCARKDIAMRQEGKTEKESQALSLSLHRCQERQARPLMLTNCTLPLDARYKQ